MNSDKINEKIMIHAAWLKDSTLGVRAYFDNEDLRGFDFSRTNLRGASFKGANLTGVSLYKANLNGANFDKANLSEASFVDANLSFTLFRKANLSETNLYTANISYSDLEESNLKNAGLNLANLEGTSLSKANLEGASLLNANLNKTDLSGVIGLLNPSDWLKANFKFTSEGVIVYKAFGNTAFKPRTDWIFKEGSVIEEVVNLNPTTDCGCGINFATKEWCKESYPLRFALWKCLLKYEDLINTCVPYNTDGKARCGRLTLIEKIYD